MGAIVVFALAAFFCLWHRTSSLMVVLGFLLIVVTIRAVDRAIHTKYVLTDDGAEVTPVVLVESGIVKSEKSGIKFLSQLTVTKNFDT